MYFLILLITVWVQINTEKENPTNSVRKWQANKRTNICINYMPDMINTKAPIDINKVFIYAGEW